MLAVRGKGETEKNVRVPLNHETMRALDRYLPARAAALAGRDATPALLVSPTRVARRTRQAAYGRIARLADAAGVGPLSAHGLRATLITVALRRGIALRDVQDARPPRRPAHHPPLRPRQRAVSAATPPLRLELGVAARGQAPRPPRAGARAGPGVLGPSARPPTSPGPATLAAGRLVVSRQVHTRLDPWVQRCGPGHAVGVGRPIGSRRRATAGHRRPFVRATVGAVIARSTEPTGYASDGNGRRAANAPQTNAARGRRATRPTPRRRAPFA